MQRPAQPTKTSKRTCQDYSIGTVPAVSDVPDRVWSTMCSGTPPPFWAGALAKPQQIQHPAALAAHTTACTTNATNHQFTGQPVPPPAHNTMHTALLHVGHVNDKERPPSTYSRRSPKAHLFIGTGCRAPTSHPAARSTVLFAPQHRPMPSPALALWPCVTPRATPRTPTG